MLANTEEGKAIPALWLEQAVARAATLNVHPVPTEYESVTEPSSCTHGSSGVAWLDSFAFATKTSLFGRESTPTTQDDPCCTRSV
jgi:hypothetical protein